MSPSPAPPPLPRKPKRRWWIRRVLSPSRYHNALLGWEVLRAGRRTGTLAIARTALGGLLLGAMWALYTASLGDSASFTGSGSDIGKKLNSFAESFAVTFFMVQATAVLLLTPVFVAGAIFEERETRSGEILLTTELTRREVYIGKVGARMVQVLLVVMAGMPILFLTQLWGGVAIEMILVCYAATGLATVGAGVLTAAVSAYAETMRGAILRTYAGLLLFDGVIFPASPYFVIFMAGVHWGAGLGFLIVYVPLQLVLVFVGYFIGQRWLRMAMLRQKTRIVLRRGLPPPLPSVTSKLPPLGSDADPLVWKELNAGGRLTVKQAFHGLLRGAGNPGVDDRMEDLGFFRWLITSRESAAFLLKWLSLMFLTFLAALTVIGMIPPEWVVRFVGAFLLAWLIAAVGLTAATGISRERQRQTLIDLLMLPGPRSDLLRAKALGALARGIWPAFTLGLVVLVTMIGLGTSIVAGVCLMLLAAGLTIFATGAGIWLSTWSKSALNATGIWIGVMAGVVIGTFLLAEANVAFNRDPENPRTDYPAWSRAVNPLLSWGRLAFRYDYKEGRYEAGPADDGYSIGFADVGPALICPVLFGAIGMGLWLLAVRQFEREGRT